MTDRSKKHPTVTRLTGFLVACATGLTGLVGLGVAGAGAAQAANLADFDPGQIISDSIFFDSTTMNATQVQSFLASKGASCVATSGNTCLKNYAETTPTRPADSYCSTYQGAASEKASSIIVKASVACGINPQVLIVTLQKEQGLVTATAGKSAATYAKALGFGCPDSAACNPTYAGFANQVYSAARQFKLYTKNPGNYTYQAGMTNNILYNPNKACGTKAVFIQNQATANLYDYTPYTPNAAALAAGYGTGDSCSSYGNRNFWNYFTDWFGSTLQRAPVGSFDALTQASPVAMQVRGWALDPDTTSPIAVAVYVDGVSRYTLTANTARADVGAAYGKGNDHGFDQALGATTGAHQVCLYAIDSRGKGPNPKIGCRSITLVNHSPAGAFDSATPAGPTSVTLTGWALDSDTANPIAVAVYVDGVSRATLTANLPRPDVAAAKHTGPNHGFSSTVTTGAGTHKICLYGIDSLGKGPNPSLGCRTVDLTNHSPIGRLDTARASGPTSVAITGWAFDPDTAASIPVAVYVDGVSRLTLTANASRPDVATAYGVSANHGYTGTVTTTAGTHTICVYGIDSLGKGPNPSIGCKTVTVTNNPPKGSLDSATAASHTTVSVTGWAFDPDTANPIAVALYLDGKPNTTVTANAPRPDVANAFGVGPNHGFTGQLTTTAGKHTVCAYGIDSFGKGPNPSVGCKTVTVS